MANSLANSRGSSFTSQLSPTSRLEPPPSVLERGVTEDVSESDLDLTKGGGAAGRRGLRLRAGLLDWLAEGARIRKHRLLRYRKTYDYLMSSDKFI